MLETFPLSLPRTGLAKENIDLRLYRDGAAYAVPAAAALDSLGGTDYQLSIPTTRGPRWAATWDVDDQGGVHEWPVGGPPPFLIVPLRTAGLSVGDLNLRTFREGVPVALSYQARELGSPGDYLVGGNWPRYDDGSHWSVFYDIADMTYQREWTALSLQAPGGGGGLSGLGRMWQELAPQVLRTLGDRADSPGRAETVVIRRASTMEDLGGDARIQGLETVGDALTGATALFLRLASGNSLGGTLQAGATLTLGATVLVLAADATAAGGALAVTLAAPLASPIAGGTLLDLQAEATIVYLNCQVSRKSRAPMPGHFDETTMATVSIPVKGNPIPPRLNDNVELEDGTVGHVLNVPLSGSAFWKVRI